MCYMILIADCNWSAMTVMLYNSAVVTAVVIVGLHSFHKATRLYYVMPYSPIYLYLSPMYVLYVYVYVSIKV